MEDGVGSGGSQEGGRGREHWLREQTGAWLPPAWSRVAGEASGRGLHAWSLVRLCPGDESFKKKKKF